jgi:hypothetical protein
MVLSQPVYTGTGTRKGKKKRKILKIIWTTGNFLVAFFINVIFQM